MTENVSMTSLTICWFSTWIRVKIVKSLDVFFVLLTGDLQKSYYEFVISTQITKINRNFIKIFTLSARNPYK